jgi:hypothetical protein
MCERVIYHKKVYIKFYAFTFHVKEFYTNLMMVPEDRNM